MIRVGVDLSYSSPSITIKENNVYNCYFVSDKKNLKKKVRSVKNRHGEIFNFKNIYHEVKHDKENRYKRIYNLSLDLIKVILKYKKKGDISICIEDYVYGSTSQSVSVLCEMGGVFRALLVKNGLEFDLINNKTLKKYVSSGNATKYEMYLSFMKYNDIDIKELFNDKSNVGVTNPVEDIIDSFFIVKLMGEIK